jgi:hypothetical protein
MLDLGMLPEQYAESVTRNSPGSLRSSASWVTDKKRHENPDGISRRSAQLKRR